MSKPWKAGVQRRALRGFMLLETMMGVAVFAVGVLVLAKCMDHCFDAEVIRVQDQLARVALENQMAAIEGGAVEVGDETLSNALEGRFSGITLKTWRTPLEWKNENDEELSNLFEVTIEALWQTPQGEQSRSLSFYVVGEP